MEPEIGIAMKIFIWAMLILFGLGIPIIFIGGFFESIKNRKRKKEQLEHIKELTKDWRHLTKDEIREIEHESDKDDE